MQGPGQQTVEVEERLRFDERALRRFLAGRLPGFGDEPPHGDDLEVKKFGYGASNPTFFLSTSSGHRYVLRKKPPGKLIKGAHAVEREFRIMKALHRAGFATPQMHLLCEDESVIGTPFYIMGFVQGRIVDNGLRKLPKQQRRPAMLAIVEALAKLHSYDPVGLGLMESGKAFGQAGGFYDRQIKTMSRTSEMQVAGSEGKVASLRSMPALQALFTANMPEDKSCVVHGDWKPDNVILSDDESSPSVLAVVDWELSTIGHPMSDLANLCLPYHLGSVGQLVNYGPLGSGTPSEQEVHQAYCRAASVPFPIRDWSFFVAFACLRLAVIVQGVAMRTSRGQASLAEAGAQVEGMARVANELCDLGCSIMSKAYAPEAKL